MLYVGKLSMLMHVAPSSKEAATAEKPSMELQSQTPKRWIGSAVVG
jgi:hypothetical protein